MTTPTISPAPAAGNTPSGPYTPTAHTHPFTAITGLRFGANGRVEPVYDAANVYANGQVIALYNASSATGGGVSVSIPPVTVVQAIQNVEGDDDNTAGKVEADKALADGKITQQEYDQITKTPEPKGPGVSAPASVPAGSIDGVNIYKDGDVFTMDTPLTANTTLGDMIKRVTFPRTIAQLSQAYPGMKPYQVVNNLGALAKNIYEPLKKQYPKAFMTNSFRHGATIGGGQHGTGQAADFQFHGVHSSAYFDIAVWMSKNLPFDQLLLEYLPGKTVWCHCSYAIPGLPFGGISVLKNKGKGATLATLNGASGGKFTPGLHADIVEAAGINRVVAG